jgi:hypothetical protein
MDTPDASNPLDNGWMETSAERRRRKLALLCEKHGRDFVAQKSGTNQFALEQVIKGVLLPAKKDGTRSPRNLGDAAARAIEVALDLGEGWFDAPDDVESLSVEALNLAKAYELMTPTERVRLGHLMAASLDIDLSQPARPDWGGLSGLVDLDDEQAKNGSK